MAETSEIARIAERVSAEIFDEFLWTRHGSLNQNWPCEKQEQHGLLTNPTDVVFYYDDPYDDITVYVQCDLKSYSVSSIARSVIEKAVVSLSKQVSCAEISEVWQEKYTIPDRNFSITGMLFVYNHDDGFDREFPDFLAKMKLSSLDLPPDSRLWVLGPIEIHWLHNVVNDLLRMRGRHGSERLPDRDACSYFYPQQWGRAKFSVDKRSPASLEMLTAPWIILKFDPSGKNPGGFVFYVRDRSISVDSFVYLLDYMRLHELLSSGRMIVIKSFDEDGFGQANLQKAKIVYMDSIVTRSSDERSFAELVNAVKFETINHTISQFSSFELGMDYER